MNVHDADPSDIAPPVPEPVASESEPTAAERPKRKRAPRKKAESADADPRGAESAAEAPQAGAAAASEGQTPLPLEALQLTPMEPGSEAVRTPAEGEGEGAPRREGGRRSRNRRRGRRGGDRAERGERPAALAEGEIAPEEGVTDTPRPAPPQAEEVFAELLSGAFDAEPEATDVALAAPPKRVLAAEPDAPKLHKVLAQAGVGSRRDMEQMILDGRITVNGEPAHIGQRISFGDRISVGGKPVRVRIAPPPPRVLAYHKPAGEVVTHDDPQQRPTVFRRLPRLQQGKWQSVGRLDINTEGLLLFTNSGELANRLMHPRFGVEREYAVRSLGVLDEAAKVRLLEGVEIDGQRAAFKSIADGGGEGANHWYRVVITEGRNREVRKLFEAVGHPVSRLIRIRYGSVVLPLGLRRGVWVDLDERDVALLRRVTQDDRGGTREPDAEGTPRRGRRGGRRGRGDRPDRGERLDRPPRQERPQGDNGDGFDAGHGGAIPNPLQQTFDKRAIQQARAPRREIAEDGPIPNPLQQTFDKRAMQQARNPKRELSEDGPIPNPLQQTYDKRFAQPSKPSRGGGRGSAKRAETGGRQPDPMQTSVGYIGADAFKRKGGRGGGGGGRGGRGGRGPGR